MLRTVYGDPDRYVEQYWKRFPGIYFTGDGARRDEDGYFWIMGRVDDVINVAGHRLGTMEVESALVSHPTVAEAAVVGRPDDLKGQALAASSPLQAGQTADEALHAELKEHVVQGDRRPRPARRDPLHRRAAQDAQRQDHAAPAARHRRRQGDARATPRRSRTTRCSRSCARRRSSWTRSRVFAPGSVSNLGPGFDCLGIAFTGKGDPVTARRVARRPACA